MRYLVVLFALLFCISDADAQYRNRPGSGWWRHYGYGYGYGWAPPVVVLPPVVVPAPVIVEPQILVPAVPPAIVYPYYGYRNWWRGPGYPHRRW